MIVFAVLFAVLLGICIFLGLPRARNWQRITSVLTYVLLIGVVYAGSIDLLGSPKPMRLEWRAPAKATVIAARMAEGKAIYIWLQAAGAAEPRAYVLPWSMQTAEQLNAAMQEGEANGRPVRMSLSASGGEEGTPKFYAQPQRPLPAKDRSEGGTVTYRHPDG